MLEIRRETLDKLDEMLEHIDTAFLWVIKYVEKNHIPLDEAMSFHIKRLQILLQEINTPLTCNPIISDEKPPRDKLTVYLEGGVRAHKRFLIPDSVMAHNLRVTRMGARRRASWIPLGAIVFYGRLEWVGKLAIFRC